MAIAQSMMRAALTTLVLSMIFASVGAANTPQTFLNVRNLQTIDVGTTLQQFVQGTSPFALRRMDKIHASMERSFQALPTNTDGLLSPPAVRYLVHNYFAQEHGWLINGLGSHSHNSAAPAAVHHADVLQSKAPEILEALLQAQHSRRASLFTTPSPWPRPWNASSLTSRLPCLRLPTEQIEFQSMKQLTGRACVTF